MKKLFNYIEAVCGPKMVFHKQDIIDIEEKVNHYILKNFSKIKGVQYFRLKCYSDGRQ